MSFKHTFNKLISGAMSLTGMIGSVGLTVSWLETSFEPSYFLGYFVLGGMGYFGTKNYMEANKKIQAQLEQKNEQNILRMAALSGGKLTVTEVTLKMNISVDDAKKTLESLSKKGAMEIEISPSGGMVYAIANYLSPEEKFNTYKLN